MIYLDNAATTKLRSEVLNEMLPFLQDSYGNPSSVYKLGRDNRVAIDKARESVAKSLNCLAEEVIFTSGGTESDNWAIKGIASSFASKGKHIISTNIEHHAVLHSLDKLKKDGYEITLLNVDENGLVNAKQLEEAIREDTILITIMHANNEIGTIQPIKELAEVAHKMGVLFHTDAVQTMGHIPIDVQDLGVDMLSLSGHKFGGPKGVGVLYVKKGVKLFPFIDGGGQEWGRRAGTENVAGIVGLAKALEISIAEQDEEMKRLLPLRDKLIDNLLKIPYSRLNGDRLKRLPNNVNISFQFIEGESMLLLLDMQGISASSGSACTSGSLDPSHVLLAIGLPHEQAHGSLRLTLGADTTEAEIDEVLEKISPIIERLRQMSPLKPKEYDYVIQ